MREIANDELITADIPDPNANWNTISAFALTFNGYDEWGSLEACAEVVNAQRHNSLKVLRTCLFYEHRRWRHFDEEPDEKAMEYIRRVIEGIRCHVALRDVE